MSDMDISQKINELFDEKNTPQRKRVPALARITGVSSPGARKWLLGEVKTIRYDNLKAIADYFSISIDELVEEDKSSESDELDNQLKQLWDSLDGTQREVALEVMNSMLKLSGSSAR